MKRFFLILGFWGLGVSLFAESPSYFRDPDSKNGRFRPNSSIEERYQYLYGKRITVEEKLAFLYDDTITYHKQFNSVWDLEAKDWLLLDLMSFVTRGLTVDATEEERERFRDSRMQALEMMTNLYREIFEEYRSGEDEIIEKQLREQIRVFIKTRSEEDRKAYLRTMFLRDRNYYIFHRILVSLHNKYYITALVGNFRDDPSRMLDYYDRSLLIKGSGTKLSKYVRREHPREKQLISRLEELEHAREKEIVEKEKPSSVPKKNEEEVQSSAPVEESSSAGSFVLAGAFVLLGGFFLWRKLRSRKK